MSGAVRGAAPGFEGVLASSPALSLSQREMLGEPVPWESTFPVCSKRVNDYPVPRDHCRDEAQTAQ